METRKAERPGKHVKMVVEIWSDIRCPFCYIGKRRFENALARFAHRDEVDVRWKSFQLDPGLKTDPSKNVNAYLAERKGWSLEHAAQLNARVTRMAAEAGLTYDFDRAVVANSRDAHRLIQMAKREGRDDAMEERLFRAYFSEGRNIADGDTLAELGAEAGLNEEAIRAMLPGDAFSEAVEEDVLEARRLGVSGVPFFVIDRKFAVSGAQETDVFLQALERAHDLGGSD